MASHSPKLRLLQRKLGLFIVAGVVLVGVLAVFWSNFFNRSVKAAWWNDSFVYRNSVPISSHTAAENSVYISVTLDSSANFQADCGDLRWTDYGGKPLPYYIVSGCGGASTVVHVLLQSFPAGAQTLYYYYGNSTAANGFSASDFATQASNYVVGTIGSQEKTVGPVAYWDFNDGTGTVATDRTGYGNNGTLTNMVSPPVSNSGWISPDRCISSDCLAFDGGDDYVAAGSNPITGSSAFTIQAWLKPETHSNYGIAMYAGDASTANSVYLGWVTTAQTGTSNSIGGGFYGTNYGSGVTQDGKWHHVSLSFSGGSNGTVTLFVDGRQRVTSTFTPNLSSTAVYFGRANSGVHYDYNGFIDEPKIYNYARSADQIRADYNNRISEMKGSLAVLGAETENALNNGLVGYWKMDESSWGGTAGEVRDASGNGNNGTAVNGATTAGGKFGNGGSFDGSNDYVNVANATSLQFERTNSFSFAGWIKTSTSDCTSILQIFNKAETSAPWTGYWFQVVSSDAIEVQIIGSSGQDITKRGISDVCDQTWHHVVVTYDGSSQASGVTLFVDGRIDSFSVSSDDLASSIANSQALRIGAYDTGSQPFTGVQDEIRIYNRALSPAEVSQLYRFAPGPIGYWTFDEGTGTTVKDSSTYGNGGSWNGTGSVHWVNGKVGKAGKFNGSDDYVEATNLLTGATAFTFSTWVYPTAWGAYTSNFLAGQNALSDWTGAVFSFDATTIGLTVYNGSGFNYDNYNTTSGVSISLNRWYHFTFQWDATHTMKTYIDGKLYSGSYNAGGTPPTSVSTSQPFRIGTNRTSHGGGPLMFNGYVDDAKLYNYIRTPEQIIDDMKGTATVVSNLGGGNRPGATVGYWDFDEGSGTVAHDRSGNGNDGTLTNMALPATSTSGWSREGKYGGGVIFDGSNDKVQLGSALVSGTGDFSISAWINRSATGTVDYIAGNYGTGGCSGGLEFYVYGGVGGEKLYTYIGSSILGTTALGASTWYHAVVTRSSGVITLYLNGKRDGGGTLATSIGSDCNLTIGNGPNYTTEAFAGTIDEVKVYNYGLTAEEVKAEFNQGKALVLGSLSDTSQISGGSVGSNSVSGMYCVPGSSESCASPVAEWNFSEGSGTTVSDTSGNANTGTWNGTAPYWTQGKEGWGGRFNGSDDYVSVADSSSLNLSLGYTISFWLKTNISGTGVTLVRRPSASTTWNYAISTNDSGGYLRLTTASSGYNLTTNVLDNKWHHVEVVVTTGGAVQWYVDGIARDAYTGATTTTGSAVTCIGETATNSTTCANSALYSGVLDQIRIFNYARSAGQVAWDYSKGKPVGHWDFDECQGTTAYDKSGNGNNGTINGTAGTCQANASTMWYQGRSGKFNSSLYFNGTSDYVSVADSAALSPTTQVTISAWVKSSDTLGGIVDKNRATSYDLHINNTFRFQVNNSAVNAVTTPNGNWQHIVGTYDGTTQKIYVNGKLENSNALSGAMTDTADSLMIGRLQDGYYLDGQIDDVQIFNYALTSVQVKQIMNQSSGVRFGPSAGSP